MKWRQYAAGFPFIYKLFKGKEGHSPFLAFFLLPI